MAEQLLEGETEQLVRKVVDLAKNGNIQALRLCLDRALPIRKERSIELEFLPAKNAQDLAANFQCVLAAVGDGRITPAEAQALTEILSSQARLFETVELEHRVQELEELQSVAQAYRHQRETEAQRFALENKETH